MSGSILLINGDPAVQRQVEEACAQLGASVTAAEDLDAGTRLIDSAAPDLVLLDVEAPAQGGFALFEQVHARWPRLCAILIAERARSEQAIEAMKRGAIDYLLKPLNHDDLVNRIGNALRISRDISLPPVYEDPQRERPVDRIIGQSPAMHEVFKLIGLIAPRDVNVLITGESGTGKELVARAIYHHSSRKDRPFVAVNCAAIPETLLESELFGHERGAFTGAEVRRIGKFEHCDGGTLLLDEIGDMPPATQAKLLRVLQDGSFQRLGGTATLRCNVRIIAATNQPLERLLEERRFRQDLYYRLKVTEIPLPPLREREVDAVLLAHYFVQRYNPQFGTQVRRFSAEVLPALLRYPWLGNVRELENVIKSALVVSRGNVLHPDFLPERIRSTSVEVITAPAAPGPAGESSLRQMCRRLLSQGQFHGQLHQQAVTAAETEVIVACLEHTKGQLAPAARVLGMTRTTLRRKIASLGIQVSTSVRLSDSGGATLANK